MNRILLLIWVLVLCVACQKKSKIDKNGQVSLKYLNQKDEVQNIGAVQEVSVVYLDSIESWKGYFKVKESLLALKQTSANEILSQSPHVLEDVILMRDSIPFKDLRVKGMSARLNAMYNQALRLREMQDIPAITAEEITNQTEGLFVLFHMVNQKINAIYDQIDFENQMLEDEFVFSLKDSVF